jgi:iron complex transport system ATP-binding protein
MLHVKNISFSIKNKSLLKSVSFEATQGEMRVFVGPNGAGKTTLLKTISNIYKKDSGEVKLNKDDIGLLKPKELSKVIAYMPQFSEVPKMSVLEVLELGRYTYCGAKMGEADRKIIDNIVKSFSLQDVLNTDISTLSGGQRQKILLASCLVQEPKILILDEPISHLDPKNQLDVLRVVKKFTKEHNIITLIVLHDIQHALHYGDKLLMMKEAKVVYDISSKEVQEHHLNEVFDVHAKLFREENHTFVYYQHSHLHVEEHNHKH